MAPMILCGLGSSVIISNPHLVLLDCREDPNGYHTRVGWTPEKFIEFQVMSGMTDRLLAKFRVSRIKELFEQRDKDEEDYAKMYGIIKSTLNPASQRHLKEHADHISVELSKRPSWWI